MSFLYPFLPSIFSIYLMLVSRSGPFLVRLLDGYRTPANPQLEQAIQKHSKAIRDLALDWSVRVGFFNAMLAAIASSVAVYAGSNSVELLIGVLIIVLITLAAGEWWIKGIPPRVLVSTRPHRRPHWISSRLVYADVLTFAVILINLLIIAILIIGRL